MIKISTQLKTVATENAKAKAEKDLTMPVFGCESISNILQEGENVRTYSFGPIGSGYAFDKIDNQ